MIRKTTAIFKGIRVIALLSVFMLTNALAGQVDINNASLADIQDLPLTVSQAQAVYEYVQYHGPLESIYELVNVPELQHSDIEVLKTRLTLKPDENASTNTRLEDQYRKVEDWTSTEGASEGLMELWLERLAEPIDVNTATYDDLVSFQNVSPIDAVAVLKLREESGSIGSARWLRNAIGLSYYGYRNLREFVTYSEPEGGQWHVWYNMVMKTIPSTNSAEEESAQLIVRKSPPDIIHKLSFSNSRHWKAGLSYNRQLGEANRYFNDGNIPEVKMAFTVSDYNLGPLHLDRLVLGNFSATFGQGLVMQSTDFRSPRYSGYGWNKRVNGIYSDLSRTQEYALRGVGIQGSILNHIKLMAFASKNDRDAILNADGDSFTALITMYPRDDFGYFVQDTLDMLNAVNEVTYGGNIRYEFSPGTFVGFSSYESLYDKELRPDPLLTLILPANTGLFLNSSGNGADTELAAMHASSAASSLWDAARSNRRVQGLEFSTTISNLALQLEWGVLDEDSEILSVKNDPQALVANAFLQFDNFNFMVLYRDYDLGFDNPYQRSFSNYQRYKSSILEDYYYLKNPYFAFLYNGAAQPQAERGVYVSSRYQMHRAWLLTTNFDTWTRVADASRYFRTVTTLEYRPTFNYRFRLRQKWQARGRFNIFAPTGYENRETILTARMRLSGFDQLEVTYANSYTQFDPRRRLTIDLATGANNNSAVGQASSPGDALGFTVTHNFTESFKLIGHVTYYKGFFWSFEDTDFQVFDSPNGAIRWYVTAFSRLGNHWAVRAKLTWDEGAAISNYAFGAPTATTRSPQSGLNYFSEATDFRIQLDYAF
ncbi:MAG: helix-hairpin-helix domain-containing protein [Candidatus Marinimicrobia bacterium]|nr:helix-hairpin-helix domain-containing protein [Candidatus Neomarinimicrobiota bacterium]